MNNILVPDNRDILTYYLYYLDNIYTLIHSKIMTYSWEKIEDIDILEEYDWWNLLMNEDWNPYGNFFLKTYKKEKIKLAEDILKRGMYAPFLGYYIGINENKKKQYSIISGIHRIISLKIFSKIQPTNKELLFLTYSSIEEELEQPIKLYRFKDNFEEEPDFNIKSFKIVSEEIDTIGKIKHLMDFFIGYMNRFFFESEAPPSPIINDKKLFEFFLKTGTVI